jgi:hypothetical protein
VISLHLYKQLTIFKSLDAVLMKTAFFRRVGRKTGVLKDRTAFGVQG